jgi:hypothetical protein
MTDHDESRNPAEHDHPSWRDQQTFSPGRQQSVPTIELTYRAAELSTLNALILDWQKAGLDPSGGNDQWARSFRHHADENLTRVANVAAALRLDWSAADLQGDQSAPPVMARLCFNIWYMAGILSGAKGWGAGDALPPHSERLPRFWATPLAVRQWIREGFAIERARLADG